MKARAWIVLHLLAMFVPAIALVARLPDVQLYGVVPPQVMPPFTWRTWFDEQVQPLLTAYVDENITARGVLVRADNAIARQLSGETGNNSPMEYGRRGTLFSKEDLWFSSKLREDVPRVAAIEAQVAVVRELQDAVDARSRRLGVVYAPAKTSLYPDDVPERWRRPPGIPPADVAVHAAFQAAVVAHGARVVDARRLLSKAPYPREDLYARYGRHWTDLGACLALMETHVLPIRECDYMVDEVDWLGHADYDLARLANVWAGRPPQTRAPVLAPRPTDVRPEPRVLFVGTSFTWNLAEAARAKAMSSRVLYYNETLYAVGDGSRRPMDAGKRGSPERRRVLLDADVYVLELLEAYVPATYASDFLSDLRDALRAEAASGAYR